MFFVFIKYLNVLFFLNNLQTELLFFDIHSSIMPSTFTLDLNQIGFNHFFEKSRNK